MKDPCGNRLWRPNKKNII
jgi:hypothetical protein